MIDYLIIGNNIYSNISNSDWVSFLGGYVGTIIGCIVSLIGILWTIDFTREQNRADRELQIRPVLDTRCTFALPNSYDNNWLGYVTVMKKTDGENFSENTKAAGTGILYLKNVGNGSAININAQASVIGKESEYSAFFSTKNDKVTTNSISPNETAALSLDVYSSQSAPSEADITWDPIHNRPIYDQLKYKIPGSYEVKVIISYNDLLMNEFSEEFVFTTSFYMYAEKGQPAKYHCDVNLKKKSTPVIVKKKTR